MNIPKYLQRPGMTAEAKKRLEDFVKKHREIMKKAPTFPTQEEAVKGAVKMAKNEALSFPSVWKEPKDIGTNYAAVHTENREDAQISGYEETVGEQEIHDLANGIKREVDEIEEV